MLVYFDSETCGLTGPMILLQYATEEGDIKLHEVFNEPISKTLDLCEYLVSSSLVGFNLVFDSYHLNKIYNILYACKNKDIQPNVQELIEVEASNPNEFCLKPPSCMDLMLHARKGVYQSTMARKPIVIRNIPQAAAYILAKELTERVELPAIYFARKAYEWKVKEYNPEVANSPKEGFCHLELDFGASSSLGNICFDAFGEEKADFPISKSIQPTELSWKPYGQNGPRPWGSVIYKHITHWSKAKARYYAERDIYLTRKLYHHFKDPALGDDDSTLAFDLGATRHKGFALNKDQINELSARNKQIARFAPISPKAARAYLHQVASPEERIVINSTKKTVLQSLERSNNRTLADRATNILAARKADKRRELLNKLSKIESFHPDFKVIGTRSNRMAGGSESSAKHSINPQGIPREESFRRIFKLAFNGESLVGGDAKSYEVSIMAAIFNDQGLNNDLQTGKKFHALLWSKLFKMSYDELVANEDKYAKSKNTSFSWAYGAQAPKVASTAEVTEKEAQDSLDDLNKRYPGIAKFREKIFNNFCSMRQPNGIGTKVVWHEPAEFAETIFGFRRYFTLENRICRILFELANKPPESLRNLKNQVYRTTRFQTTSGAIQSALYAGAFNIQANNLRQAGNHYIQSVGGQICKALQRALTDLQPSGVNRWIIRTMNVHDEVLAVTNGTVNTKEVVKKVLDKYRKYIPLLDWDWKELEDWSDTK